MAFFGVTIETIEEILPHPNADKLEICKLCNLSFQFIILKGMWKVADACLYFPIDSLVPEDVAVLLGVEGKLAGKKKNRIKTIRLRGIISQGIIAELSTLHAKYGDKKAHRLYNILHVLYMKDLRDRKTKDYIQERVAKLLAGALGITKYEPPPTFSKNARMISLPCGMSPYDIEGAERYQNVVDEMMDKVCVVTEKMEGSNWSCTIVPTESEPEVYVNTRRHALIPIDEGGEHIWWAVAKSQGLVEFVTGLAKVQSAEIGQPITLYGEMCGPRIQGNIYKFPTNQVYIFDIKIGTKWLSWDTFSFLVETLYDSKWLVPVISQNLTLREWMTQQNATTIDEVSTGNSVFGEFLREGIVIRTRDSIYIQGFGRALIKRRSSEYLAGTSI